MLKPNTNSPSGFEVIDGGRSLTEFNLDPKETLENLKHVLLQFYKIYDETRREYGVGPDPDFVVQINEPANGQSRDRLFLVPATRGSSEITW